MRCVSLSNREHRTACLTDDLVGRRSEQQLRNSPAVCAEHDELSSLFRCDPKDFTIGLANRQLRIDGAIGARRVRDEALQTSGAVSCRGSYVGTEHLRFEGVLDV